MVMLRRSSSGVEAPKRDADMDTSSEFLSLRRAQKKSARVQKGLGDSCSSVEHSPTNVSSSFSHETRFFFGVGFLKLNAVIFQRPYKFNQQLA